MVDQTDPLLIVKSWLRISDGTARVFCPYDASRNSLAKYFITEVCEEMGGSEASHLVLNADNIQSAVYNAKDIVEIERRISRKSVDEEYNRIRSNLDCDGEADRRYFVSVTKDGTRKWMEVDFQDIRSTEKPDIERGERSRIRDMKDIWNGRRGLSLGGGQLADDQKS
ncbi:hypothetical protein HYFRA_00001538 [Hymenoscyphus fraxineus]|uniref:Uncharacterized protein n=1 Tax=Hymenoscyphus fraxineus TaxID=746836 RepID=A0A9N9L3K3_9HELO|nr:hypothetical protein HYFRA_00001538 [Hymenoscyphus fraxineus]